MRADRLPIGVLLFGKNFGHMRSLEVAEKFHMGVYRSEIRAGTSHPGPLKVPFYYTTPGRTCQVFFNKKNRAEKSAH